ncbi:hypothetical protein Sjap_012558 [Stephania japonica]|uniref:Uncharacterized protein n=1 Tax=Stephania japonica TaxID=461633 RepID=A0AAP0IYP1_9MAGN
MQLRMEFAFGEKLKEEYSNEKEFASEEEIDGDIFLYGYAWRIDPIFFVEESKNFDEEPKFVSDGYDFVENKIVFGEDGFVIEVVSKFKVPQVLEGVVGDTHVNKSFVKDFSNYHNFVVSFSDYEIKPIFEDKFVSDYKPCEGMKIRG